MLGLKLYTSMLMLFAVIGCGSNEDATADNIIDSGNEMTPEFQVLAIQHPVADLDKWMQGYMNHDSVRQAYGLSHMYVGQNVNQPSDVLVVNRMENVDQAKQFTQLPDLKNAMDDAGVTGAPEFHYVNILRSDTVNKSDNRVLIVHKVSDWNTWLQAYDNEGMETRRQHGLEDVGLGRSADDPNKVYVVFAVNDMEKARSRIESDELKQLMMNAGVEGEPEIMWYRIVD